MNPVEQREATVQAEPLFSGGDHEEELICLSRAGPVPCGSTIPQPWAREEARYIFPFIFFVTVEDDFSFPVYQLHLKFTKL